jgi:hypothetical protein
VIAARLKSLLAAEPKLKTDYNKSFLQSLEATIAPSSAQPGSIEAMIDDLMELRIATSTFVVQYQPDPRLLKLLENGFDAVPALIDHLDDPRLTRSVMTGFNNFATYHLRVGHAVRDILQGIAGKSFGLDWLQEQKGYYLDPNEVRAWWQQALAQGEKPYFLEHAVHLVDKGRTVNVLILWVMAKKYPEELAELYEKYLADSQVAKLQPGCDQFAEVIVRCSLPTSRKMQLLRIAAKHERAEHRRAAERLIKELEGADRGTRQQP